VTLAAAELARAQRAVVNTTRLASLQALRVRALTCPVDTRTLSAIATSSAQEARRTQAEVQRLGAQSGVQLPANELR
jgi:hypothetical protein